ncbi:Tyrosine decarboxylase 1 [Forsythia ovata]|uniref:Tyrosine decarboxylase 1 n=1 Tax=Forsythia ovata TaxID=205694 RepID=A0ABD1QFN3_9LAMI
MGSQENQKPETIKPLDPEEFRRQGHMVVDFLADYYGNVDKYPVRSQVQPGYLRERLPESAPHEPEPIEKILQDVQKDIVPGITHWQSPNYFAYFPSSGSIAGFLGEMLSTGFNVVGFNWMSSPAATELESIVMDWLGKMLKLPNEFLFSGGGGGVLQGTTCEAILCTLVAARDHMLNKIGRDNIGKLVVYGSDQTHSALQKAAQIAVCEI